MIYCISDLHGQYNAFIKMLKKINFSDNDELYILGDMFDRGNENLAIYNYVIDKPNIHVLWGNHEDMMYNYYRVSKFYLSNWIRNGGETTKRELDSLAGPELEDFLNFINRLQYYKVLKVNGQKFILCHAGMIFNNNYDFKENFKNNILNDRIIWNRSLDVINPPRDYILIHGHTPVQYYFNKNYIVKYRNKKEFGYVFDIDCGCAGKHRLGCLCLDNFKRFYVNIKETY